MQQGDLQHGAVRPGRRRDPRDRRRRRPQVLLDHSVEIVLGDAPPGECGSEELFGEVAPRPQLLARGGDGVMEGHVLKGMEGVVMNEYLERCLGREVVRCVGDGVREPRMIGSMRRPCSLEGGLSRLHWPAPPPPTVAPCALALRPPPLVPRRERGEPRPGCRAHPHLRCAPSTRRMASTMAQPNDGFGSTSGAQSPSGAASCLNRCGSRVMRSKRAAG
jgi:hypothetical protein